MAAQSRKLTQIASRVRALYEKERQTRDQVKRSGIAISRWALMLYHEFLRDDVQVRAQSLSFLMIFSLLPLIAGAFFVFTIFAQFGFVQDALQGFVNQFLNTIPPGHREFVRDYVVHFKDVYLASMSEKSGTIGIFALFILIWVGLQTFNNVDRMLNYIWSADRQRPFLEQIRNFMFVAVAAPLLLVTGLSIPLILQKVSATRLVFDVLPVLTALLNFFLTPALLFCTFTMIYRYVPVRRVKWKPALWGATFSTVGFQLANYLMQLYFAFGTNSAYGKAAIVPLIGFWIYVVWMIIILGAEVSFLAQNSRDILFQDSFEPTLRDGAGLLGVMAEALAAHRSGKNPVDFERFRIVTGLTTDRLHSVLAFLLNRRVLVECTDPDSVEGAYALGRGPDSIEVEECLRDFYKTSRSIMAEDLDKLWREAVTKWWGQFKDLTLNDLVPEKTKRR